MAVAATRLRADVLFGSGSRSRVRKVGRSEALLIEGEVEPPEVENVSHGAQIHGLRGRRQRNELFRGAWVVGCSPVRNPTIGLVEDMPGRNLKHTTRRKHGPALRWIQRGPNIRHNQTCICPWQTAG